MSSLGGNPDSNTLLSDMTTVVCLDDYHCLDRYGRKEKGVTALDPKAQNFDLMYEQVRDIRDNKPIHKPIYNHVTGLLDPEETVRPPKVSSSHSSCSDSGRYSGDTTGIAGITQPLMARKGVAKLEYYLQAKLVSQTFWNPVVCVLSHLCLTRQQKDVSSVGLQIMVLEGLHPFYDERVRDLYDFRIYLDISDEVKFAWKIQRDMKERGHSLESIKASIEARRPDFDAYIDPQKKHADVIIQVRILSLVTSDQGFICHDATVMTSECGVHNQFTHRSGFARFMLLAHSCISAIRTTL